jgi:hypothetical protein
MYELDIQKRYHFFYKSVYIAYFHIFLIFDGIIFFIYSPEMIAPKGERWMK